MVESYYAPGVTEYSERELRTVLQAAEPPVALLGGWAVHLHVTDRFADEQGREYIGSRDIDVGVHVDSGWSTPPFRTSRSARRSSASRRNSTTTGAGSGSSSMSIGRPARC